MGPRTTAVPVTEQSVTVAGLDPLVDTHRQSTLAALRSAGEALQTCAQWGRRLAALLPAGGRVLVCGNGGSAAEAQHLTAELVGRFREDRPAYSALSLSAETSSLTALVNDYGAEEMFARQVAAHGRPGDVLMMLTTSGRSPNLLAAARAAADRGLLTWALTGPAPNPLSAIAQECAAIPSSVVSAIQEVHLVGVHVLSAAFDSALGYGGRS